MLTTADLEARKHRLEQLSLGMARDLAEINERDDPLYLLEHWAYNAAIHRAWGGIEVARVTLSKALQRLRGEPRPYSPADSPCPRPLQEGESLP
jgi:hypothetical protein